MQIHKFQERDLAEDYVDVHYREPNAQIRGLFSYLDSMAAVVGKNDHGEKLIAVSEIYYCEIVDRKCFAYLEKEVYQIDYGLQQFLDDFHGQGMVRVSKSMCVNVFFLSRIEADFNMKAKLVMKNGEVLQLNRSYKNFRRILLPYEGCQLCRKSAAGIYFNCPGSGAAGSWRPSVRVAPVADHFAAVWDFAGSRSGMDMDQRAFCRAGQNGLPR